MKPPSLNLSRLPRILCALLVLGLFAGPAQATTNALAANRSTPSRDGGSVRLQLAPSVEIFRGAMVSITNGLAVPASDTPNHKAIGRSLSHVTSGATNAVYVTVSRGIFRWNNDGSYTDANIGETCYVKNDQAVDTAANRSADIPAGVIFDVDASGVWVDNR